MKRRLKIFFIDLCKKNKVVRKIYKRTSLIHNKIKYSKYKRKYKVNDKLVLFDSYQSRSFACSPKQIYLNMINDPRFDEYEFVWCFSNTDREFSDKRTRIVKKGSKEYYKTFASAKYWIVNSLIPEEITPKKNQIFVQCWHGTPLKKLRYDIEHSSALNDVDDIRRRNDIDAKRYTYFLSPSKFCTEVFTSAFNLKKLKKENIMVEQGYPRNDFLFSYTEQDIKEIKDKLNINTNKKIILYAPTFRDNQHTSGVGYTYNLGIDLDKLQKELSNEYIILFRTHYFVSNSFDLTKYNGFIYDVSKYDDVSDLYIISDILLTDYSSVFFDFANLKRPMLFYMYDLDEYKNNLRDFYISLSELPGPIIDNENDLINKIKTIDIYYDKEYNEKYKQFNNKYNYLDSKDSSKKVINIIFR